MYKAVKTTDHGIHEIGHCTAHGPGIREHVIRFILRYRRRKNEYTDCSENSSKYDEGGFEMVVGETQHVRHQ